MLFIRRRIQGVGLIIAFVYFYGLVLGALYLVPAWLSEKLPQWAWWQFVLAPFALGSAALAIEWVFEPPSSRSAKWYLSIPQWKKAVFLLFLLFIAAMYASQDILWPCASC